MDKIAVIQMLKAADIPCKVKLVNNRWEIFVKFPEHVKVVSELLPGSRVMYGFL